MNNYLSEYIDKIGIKLNDDAVYKLQKYYEMLIEKNKVMNLTAITDYEDVVIKHYADSLAVVNRFNIGNINSLIDIGTGAGFPGMVLKIVFPQIEVVLLDSLNKRVNFLNDVIKELKLTGIKAMHGRAEDLAHEKEHREKYDLCVSRAVANLSTLSEYCIPFVKVGGIFISYKAEECDKEVNDSLTAITKLGGSLNKIEEYILPMTDINRKFVIIDKVISTKNTYPRKAGVPSKEPLK